MFLSMSFGISGICYVLIITCVYFWKRKTDENRNLAPFFFRFMLFFTSFIFLLEIACIVAIHYEAEIPILTEFLCRLHIMADIVWFTIFLVYVWCATKKPVDDVQRRTQRNNVTWLLLIVGTVLYFITCFLDVTYQTSINSNIKMVGGSAMYLVYAIGVIYVLAIVFIAIKYKNRFSKTMRLPLYYFAITLLAIVILQLVLFDYRITFIMYLFCFGIVGLFFTIESQDTKILNEVENSKQQAEIANKAKTEFLSSVSHQIRTPMNTILGFSQALLEEPELTEEIVKKDAASIKEASASLLELINNILDISRIESNKEVLDEKEYRLSDVLLEINSIILSKINKDVLNFEINVDENMPSVFYGDSNKIYLALVRVLENSIEHTNFGSITLDVGGAFAGDTYKISLVVSNSGHEMKTEEFEKDFADFADIGHDSSLISSTRLGLLVAKNLMKILNGTIDFKNEKGKGTRYIMSVDQQVIDDTKIGKIFMEDVSRTKKEIDCTGKKILIVDDNKINLKLACRMLEQFNFDISSALNGKECIDLVKENTYDMIFLDHMMPEMDGIATIHILKELGCDIPIIALTANSYTGLRDTYIKEGFNDYLAKPINYKNLYKLIKEYFGNGGEAR